MKVINKVWPVIFIIIFSLFSFTPFFIKGFFPIHDDTQVARVYEMSKGLRDGMFPVRWSKDLGYGYGYPIFNYYDPLVYYLGGAINAIGVDTIAATKLIIVAAILLSALFMYLLASEFWGAWGGIVAALLYVYAPYHAVDIYVRGDFAESLAYAFIPLLFFGVWKIHKKLRWYYVLITSISYAAIITSHNLTALIISPFLFMFLVYLVLKNINRKKTIAYILFGVFTGLLISAFYWLPALMEMKYTNVLSQVGGGADFRDHFVCIRQLWTSEWGYGGSVKGCIDGLSFMIGKYLLIFSLGAVISSLFFLTSQKYLTIFKDNKEKLVIILLSYILFLFSVFLMLSFSTPIWEGIKPMEFIQYPWRFLIVSVFFASFISGSLFWIVRKFIKDNFVNYVVGIVLAFFIIFVSVKFFVPQIILEKSSNDYTNLSALNYKTSKISDEYMPQNFQKPKTADAVANIENLRSSDFQVFNVSQKTQELRFKVNADKDTKVVVPLAFFPAWNAYLDNTKIKVEENKRGMLIKIPKGSHIVDLKYSQTPIEIAGNLVSVTGILLLIAGIIMLRRRYE